MTVNRLSRRELVSRGLIGAAVLALPLPGCGKSSSKSSAGSVSTLRTQLIFVKSVTYAGFYIADAKGVYAREHIRSRLLSGGPDIPSVEAVVAGGSADIGMSDIASVVAANKQGADLVMFGAQFQSSPGGIMSLAKHPIRTAHDLVGARIGVQPKAKAEVDALLEVNGLPRHYTPVTVGRDPQPLVDGKCDAMTCFVTAQPLTLRLEGVHAIGVTFADLGLPDYGNVLMAKRSFFGFPS